MVDNWEFAEGKKSENNSNNSEIEGFRPIEDDEEPELPF